MNRVFLPFMRSMFAVCMGLSASLIVAAGAEAANPDPAKGAAFYSTGDAARGIPACSSCHGDGGNSASAQYPKLAAQHAAYIVKQLANFKSGERDNAIMGPYAKKLTDDEAANLAAYLSTQKLTPGAAKNKDTVEAGKKIYRAGIAEKNVPACAGCHGPTGAGIPAQFARIGGQHQEYTAAQLTNFNTDARKNNAVMTTIAKRLSPQEIQAVSDYVAGLR